VAWEPGGHLAGAYGIGFEGSGVASRRPASCAVRFGRSRQLRPGGRPCFEPGPNALLTRVNRINAPHTPDWNLSGALGSPRAGAVIGTRMDRGSVRFGNGGVTTSGGASTQGVGVLILATAWQALLPDFTR
jgi:hypothetical protein